MTFEVFGSLRSIASHSLMNCSSLNFVGTYPDKSNLVLQPSGMDHSIISRISAGLNLSDSLPSEKSGRLLLRLHSYPPPTEMLDFPCFSRKGTSPIFALGRVSPSFPTFEGRFVSGFLR
jgi:hypothetical protein